VHEKMVRVFSGHSACHAFFLNDRGDAYVMGRNEQGQCGLTTKDHGTVISTAIRLDRQENFKPELPIGSDGDIVHISCGRGHTLLCTKGGAVYSAGKNALGQCGHSNLADVQGFKKIETAPFVREKDPVVQVAAGITFSLILTKSGKGE
jgi:alpha-tubulin suppressor-like RCC1 family protein